MPRPASRTNSPMDSKRTVVNSEGQSRSLSHSNWPTPNAPFHFHPPPFAHHPGPSGPSRPWLLPPRASSNLSLTSSSDLEYLRADSWMVKIYQRKIHPRSRLSTSSTLYHHDRVRSSPDTYDISSRMLSTSNCIIVLTLSQILPPPSNSHPTRTKAETASLLPMLIRHNHLRHHHDLRQPIRTTLILPITSRPSTIAATSPLNQILSSNLLATPLPKRQGSHCYLQ